ncbi:hypothetical protein GCM10022407_26070 [Hymenobacter antarcticus]|uniref:Uncharacterized protein n=1 Tax=Hymenobacter antarcticus TaxID=486270 RepID=A0ABP7QC47_9BACT
MPHPVPLAAPAGPGGGSQFYYDDNDQGGIDLQVCNHAHCRQHGGWLCAQNEGFRGHKDPNEFLLQKPPPRPPAKRPPGRRASESVGQVYYHVGLDGDGANSCFAQNQIAPHFLMLSYYGAG